MKISKLAVYLEKLEGTSSRLAITDILADLFREAKEDEIEKISYLILGQLAPNFTGLVFNIADQMMVRVIASSYGVSEDVVKKTYKSKGDLGEVASELAENPAHKTKIKGLSVNEVYELLKEIAIDQGEKSQERKVAKFASLLSSIDSLSVKYVVRIPIGKLRLGFSDKTVIDALSVMETGDKSLRGVIEKAFNIRPDIGKLARDVKSMGAHKTLKSIKPDVEVPVFPMLAARLKSAEDMIAKMGEVAVEPKYDGLRIFIHYRSPDYIRTYTRNMNFIPQDTFPELKDLPKYINAREIILDTEAVGMDAKREHIADFQTTMQRRRKHDIGQAATDIPLQFQVFDMVLKDGKSFLGETYIKRREELAKTVKNGKLLRIDEYEVTRDPNVIRSLHGEYIKKGLEGIIVKKTDSEYVSGRTGWRWVKMKEAEESIGKLSDTIDTVVMGFTAGKGKRVGFGIGQFLAGVVVGERTNTDTNLNSVVIKSITKVGTGLTDDQFKELSARLKKIVVKEMPKEYEAPKDLTPDFWVAPQVVVELAADEITVSPKHTSGYALRFPRLVKFRDDKRADQATTLKEVQKIMKLQRPS